MLAKLTFVGFCAVLGYYGFICRRPNWLGWFMFCRASYCCAEIRCGDEVLNIWNYLPHCQVIVHKEMINNLLWYLRAKHDKRRMHGTVVLHTTRGIRSFRVRNAWLV